jgi:hypothetical protein
MIVDAKTEYPPNDRKSCFPPSLPAIVPPIDQRHLISVGSLSSFAVSFSDIGYSAHWPMAAV